MIIFFSFFFWIIWFFENREKKIRGFSNFEITEILTSSLAIKTGPNIHLFIQFSRFSSSSSPSSWNYWYHRWPFCPLYRPFSWPLLANKLSIVVAIMVVMAMFNLFIIQYMVKVNINPKSRLNQNQKDDIIMAKKTKQNNQ